ncbi:MULTISPECIES: 2-oxo acid dehydrogenase subunit E2 [Paenibacillus]|uniref:2-oxo acid dehydrogenase subunit E2 n=1 Tax=Paenibacillus TaxID=44249 RepID=UPI0022816457|nr:MULTISPECIES: 2-oxo acid dehydrogenase subunit E2 [Paenibacillus]
MDASKEKKHSFNDFGINIGAYPCAEVNNSDDDTIVKLSSTRKEISSIVTIENDEIVVRKMLPITLTFDHRYCDGADGLRFIHTFKANLESHYEDYLDELNLHSVQSNPL